MREMVRLCDICDFQGGSQPPKEEWSFEKKDDYIRMLQIRDFTQQATTVPEYIKKSKTIKTCQSDDVLIARYGASLGKILTGLSGAYNVAIMKTIPDTTKLEKKYLFYYLTSQLFQGFILNVGSRAAQAGFNKNDLNDLLIPLPPLPEQRRIAAVLDKVSELIALRKRQLDLLDAMVKARFVEMFGTINENPKHYPMAMLKDICHKITDGKHGGCEQESNSGYFYVGAREIFDNSIHYETAPQITYTDFAKDYKRCNIEVGDFVIVNTGATIGKSAIATSPLTERTLLQKSVALLKVNTEHILSEFLRYCYIVNPSMYMVESASAQPNLLLSKIKTTVVYTPPIKLQNQFADFVQQVDKSKAAVQQGLDRLILLKSALMQEYFG